MTPVEQLTVAKYGCNLTEANEIMQGSKKGQHDVVHVLEVTGLTKRRLKNTEKENSNSCGLVTYSVCHHASLLPCGYLSSRFY